MAMEIPKADKVYTHVYDNFKGVDFTNDPTNVWHRRSPTGVNMLPDASGRPFKRHGWSILLSNDDISRALGVSSCQIEKCSYFEISGVDHLAIFTDYGVLFYNGDESVNVNGVTGITAVNKDYDCYSGYDRSFFFEGNGISAFYIYGNFKVWRYESDFALHDVTGQVTVPTVLIGTNANCVGTFYSGYNLLGTQASVEYNDVTLFNYWCSDNISIAIDEINFKADKTINVSGNSGVFRWRYSSGTWSWQGGGTSVAFPDSLITVMGTPTDGDEIYILYIYGVMLPNNVSQDSISSVKVRASVSSQFDLELAVKNEDQTISAGNAECKLHTDDTQHRTEGRAWIQFAEAWTEVVQGEDFIKTEFPSVSIVMTAVDDMVSNTNTASLVGA